MKTSINLFSVFSSLVLFAYPSFVKAFDLNCSTESVILYLDGPFMQSLNELGTFMDEVCNKKINGGNGICSLSNSSNATAIHWKVTFNWTTLKQEEHTLATKDACEQAGGKLITPTFEIGYGPGFNYSEYFSDTNVENNAIDNPSMDQYLDILLIDSPECVGKETCNNETVITKYLKEDYYYGVNIYNFTMYGLE